MKIRPVQASTVFSRTCSSLATDRLDRPSASEARTSRSRGVRVPQSLVVAPADLAGAPTTGEVLFEDSLDDDQNGWALPDNEEARFYYEDGDFIWESKQENLRPHLLAAPIGEAYDAGELEMLDVVVRADVTPVQGAAVAGVFCRENPDTDADFQWYEFVVRDGFAAIRIADSEGELEVLAETEDLTLPMGEMFTMEAAYAERFIIRWHEFTVFQAAS